MFIGEIQKNSTEKIKMEIREYKGREFVDCRVYYEDDQGEWKPTKKGITFSPDKLSEVIELLKTAEDSLSKETEKD